MLGSKRLVLQCPAPEIVYSFLQYFRAVPDMDPCQGMVALYILEYQR